MRPYAAIWSPYTVLTRSGGCHVRKSPVRKKSLKPLWPQLCLCCSGCGWLADIAGCCNLLKRYFFPEHVSLFSAANAMSFRILLSNQIISVSHRHFLWFDDLPNKYFLWIWPKVPGEQSCLQLIQIFQNIANNNLYKSNTNIFFILYLPMLCAC